jgi:hypothetical protein
MTDDQKMEQREEEPYPRCCPSQGAATAWYATSTKTKSRHFVESEPDQRANHIFNHIRVLALASGHVDAADLAEIDSLAAKYHEP